MSVCAIEGCTTVKRWIHFRTQISKFPLRLVLDLRTSLLEQSGHNLFFFRGHPGDITPHGPPQRVLNLTNAALEQHVGCSTLYLSRANGNRCQNGWLLPYCRRSLSASCAAVFLSWICDIEWLLLYSLDTYLRYLIHSVLSTPKYESTSGHVPGNIGGLITRSDA